MELNAEIFWSTLIGAVVGGLIPFVVTLAWAPSRARRERRAKLYLELVPAAMAAAHWWAVEQDETTRLSMADAVREVALEGTLAGPEDRRVVRAIDEASSAGQFWQQPLSVPGLDQSRYAQRLGIYISLELGGYHEWLEHSLNRNPIRRGLARHRFRRHAPWATAALPYVDYWREHQGVG